MASNTLILKGCDGGADNGWWLAGASSITLTNANGINFYFEQTSLGGPRVTLTLKGSLSVEYTTGPVEFGMILRIPLSFIPNWARPRSNPVGYDPFNCSVGCGNGIGLELGSLTATVCNSGTHFQVTIFGNREMSVGGPYTRSLLLELQYSTV